MDQKKLVVLATGGSGGHVIPSEVLANKLVNDGIEVVFLGHKITSNPFFKKDKPLRLIDIRSAPFSLKKLPAFILSTLKGTIDALLLLKKWKPECVIGFGSYHSFPVLLAAKLLNIPIIVYESNIQMGKVIRLFAKSAKILASPYQEFTHFKNFHFVEPLIPQFKQAFGQKKDEIYDLYGLKVSKKTLLIFGGSQGAEFFNHQISQDIVKIIDPSDWQILHICGPRGDKKGLEAFYVENQFLASVISYEPCMANAYSLADRIISRCGSTTLFEIKAMQIPSILIPYPLSMDNHQLLNAKSFEKSFPCVVLEEKVYSIELFKQSWEMMDEKLKTESSIHKSAVDLLIKIKEVFQAV